MAPLRLPSPLICLTAFFRPFLLRPDLRVPNIAHLDFRALRREGFNAVVVDKDNCLTLPEEDSLYPPLKDAWTQLLAAFPRGRVLVVSNSAGTNKDPGGIAAECVSLNLRAPVLLHPIPKPACASSILAYFHDDLGAPRTLRTLAVQRDQADAVEEKEDEELLLKRWRGEVEGPLLGVLKDKEGKVIKEEAAGQEAGRDIAQQVERVTTQGASSDWQDGTRNAARTQGVNPSKGTSGAEAQDREERQGQTVSSSDPAVPLGPSTPAQTSTSGLSPSDDDSSPSPSSLPPPLRIIVIGDRLFTDTLLAHRLGLHQRLPRSSTSVISVHTTSLPQPRDVRVLRWLEERLSRGKVRQGKGGVDWRRFVVDPEVPWRSEDGLERSSTGIRTRAAVPGVNGTAETVTAVSGLARLLPAKWWRDVPPLTRSPSSWRPLPLLFGLGRLVRFVVVMGGRGVVRGVRWAWARARRRTVLASEAVKTEMPVEVTKREVA